MGLGEALKHSQRVRAEYGLKKLIARAVFAVREIIATARNRCSVIAERPRCRVGALVLAKSERPDFGDNILRTVSMSIVDLYSA